jgi:aryl-alcohol dehydrogenase-like predicted oxidoreductase
VNGLTNGSYSLRIGGDLPVRRLGFGGLHLDDRDTSRAVLHRAVELGVNLVDTADAYGPDVSELLIAEALHPYPSGLAIATKGGMIRGDADEIWPADGRPEHLRAACHASLRRLRLERIDLYQLHTVDPAVPIEESVGALAELQAEGKIRHIGVSNVNADELERARSTAAIAAVQNRYSIAYRLSEDTLEICRRDGLAFLAWQPLFVGLHTETLERVGSGHGATAKQVALAWLLARSNAVIAIPGTHSVAHLEENLAADALGLTDAERARLEREIPPFDPLRDPPHPQRSRSAHGTTE